jgi:riboflavin synthase
MFTGIVQEIGKVTGSSREGGNIRVTIAAETTAPRLRPGSSVAVNGTCLTAVSSGSGSFTAEIVEETLRKTALAAQIERGHVNLELPLRADGLIDGHIVLGHVDATATVDAIEERGESWWFSFRIPPGFMRYLVHTGSVAIDGVSLTVASISGETCRISVIPHTMQNTIFRYYRRLDLVNLEVDVIGKYVERMMSAGPPPGGRAPLTVGGLRSQGF